MAEQVKTEQFSCVETDSETSGKVKKHFTVYFYHDWCKACGICMAFCPQQIIKGDKNGKPEITDTENCVGCRFCEIHCPDFAITVSEQNAARRNGNV